MYDGIRKAVGPTKKLTIHLQSDKGEVLHSRDGQLGRSVQHLSILYSKQNVVTNIALQQIKSPPTMDDLDNKPTVEELS